MLIRILAFIILFSLGLFSTADDKNCFVEKCSSMMHTSDNFECDSCPTCIDTVVENDQPIPSKHLILIKSIIPIKYLNLYQLTYSNPIYRPPIA